MIKINNSLSSKILLNFILLINFILISGFLNSSWLGLLSWLIFFLCIYSGELTLSKKRWLIVLTITIFSLLIKTSLQTPLITEGSNVFIGGNYKNSIFKEKIPEKIFTHLNNDFKKTFPENISAPANYLFDKAVSQILTKSNESRLVKSINWSNRYSLQLSAFNNTKYNAYGIQQPERKLLPFFVKYTFPDQYQNSDSQLCWSGQAYIQLKELKNVYHEDKKCIYIKDFYNKEESTFTIWLIETGVTPKLNVSFVPPKFINIKLLLEKIIKAFLSICICLIIFKNFKRLNLFFFIFSTFFTFMLMYFYQPSILSKFLLFEGGNDGLLYVHFAHLIVDSLVAGDYIEAFRGGESAYDLMPFYRYFWVLNYILFDESPWMIIFILVFLPLVIYSIFNNLLNRNWAIFFMFCWYLFPLFEAFGFSHFYYIKLGMRGFAEPLSNLFFFSALALTINIYKVNGSLITKELIIYFLIGLMLSLSLGLRANTLPAFMIIVIYFLIILLKNKSFISIVYLGVGLLPSLIMPIHNFYFTKQFIPLTIAAYKDWNLGASPSEYVVLLASIIKFNFDFVLWNKISSHIIGEIKMYEVWYHVAILSNLYFIFNKKSEAVVRLISLASVSLILLILFYHVGGRYSYLTWTLSLIGFSCWLKNIFFPKLKKVKMNYVS